MSYLLGVLIAISAGMAANIGILLQKKAVNELSEGEKIGVNLFKKPLWLLGFVIGTILGATLFFLANTPQWGVGPALVPGLAASGYILLTIGSIKLLKEEVTRQDVVGIILMIGGITFLGFSQLEIKIEDPSILNTEFLIRATIYTISLFSLAISCQILQRAREKYRGIFLAIFSGSMFMTSNLWVAIVMGLFAPVLGAGQYIPLFTVTCIILIVTNVYGIFKIQQAFQHGDASKLIPVQQAPVQVGPILVYFVIFMWSAPKIYSLPFIISGVILILSSSIFLARRQAQLEKIK